MTVDLDAKTNAFRRGDHRPLPHMAGLSPPFRDVTPLAQSNQSIRRDELKLRSSLTDELTIGRRKLAEAFNRLPPRDLKPGELLAKSTSYRSGIFRLHAGWACQFCDLVDCGSAIIDLYLPGDVIGLDTLLQTRRAERVSTLSSATVEMIPAQHVLIDLMADRSLALYIFWLLNHHQRRVARRLAANIRFEVQARLALILLDLHTRLHRRRLVTGWTYSLPLTQVQIGDYVGLTAVHVNRVLRSLRDERVVNVEKNSVTIIDLERLKKLAREEEVVNSALTSASALWNHSSRPEHTPTYQIADR